MQIKVKYEKGVFKSSKKAKGLQEGQDLHVCMDDISAEEMSAWAIAGGSFDFLLEDEDIYTEDDIIEPV